MCALRPLEEVYRQDYVLVVRYPHDGRDRFDGPGSCLISMAHYPTRPERVADLRQRGLEAISLNSIKDDVGRRLIENLRSVAWNGVEVAFQVLAESYPAPGFASRAAAAHPRDAASAQAQWVAKCWAPPSATATRRCAAA